MIELKKPQQASGFYGKRKSVLKVYISMDEPEAFKKAVESEMVE
ncbi:hypothetical protein [Pseudalkalibacillus sp. R45]